MSLRLWHHPGAVLDGCPETFSITFDAEAKVKATPRVRARVRVRVRVTFDAEAKVKYLSIG